MSRSFEDSGGRSPLIIKDLDLYPQPPTNTRSPTLNSEEPLNTAALRDLIRDDENTQWDIATTAEYLGISAHTLRYYERAGLVKVGRDASGYRLYDAAAVRRLVFITRMRVSGMSIAQLQHYISLVEQGAETVQERLDLMLEHRDILRQRIEDLQLSLAATEFKIAMYQKGSRP